MNYLEDVLNRIQQKAYRSPNIQDWQALRQRALELAGDAQTPADCYPAVRMVMEALGDNHSFFIGADEKDTSGPTGRPRTYGLLILAPENVVIEIFPDSAAERAGIRLRDVIEKVNGEDPPRADGPFLRLDRDRPLSLQIRRAGVAEALRFTLEALPLDKSPTPHGRLLREGIGYVELFVQGDPDDRQRYTDAAQDAIRAALGQGARGWIVDLRRNRGGNMWPMLAGIGPLLGEGQVGAFVEHDGPKESWHYISGAAQYADRSSGQLSVVMQASDPVPPLDPQTTPVAVLTSRFTESAGEMTLVAFLGRPNTRTFGESSAGLTTAVGMEELEDGAILGLAMSVCADRSGRVYSGVVAPDEQVSIDWLRYGLDADPVIVAAAEWLSAQAGGEAAD